MSPGSRDCSVDSIILDCIIRINMAPSKNQWRSLHEQDRVCNKPREFTAVSLDAFFASFASWVRVRG